MVFKISNFNIMSDKHFDYYTWDEVGRGDGNIDREPEVTRDARYDAVINVITNINNGSRRVPAENIDVMTFQEVTENSIGKLEGYALANGYTIYQNQIKSVDRPILLATMIKNDLVNAQLGNIVDLTDNYQRFYNKNNYHSTQDDYFSGRAQVFYIRSKNLIVVNVHAPGLPDGFVQELWYKNLAAFIRCGCMTNQNQNPLCYPNNQNLKIILIGDFNVSDPAKIREWTNENNKLPIFELFNDPNVRNTSYHSGIKDIANNWMPDPNPYQKVDHLIHTLNLNQPRLDVYVSNNFGWGRFLDDNEIDGKIIPYSRNPVLPPMAGQDPVWQPNYNINANGWPSDHTFNLYTFNEEGDILAGGSRRKIDNKTRKYRIIY